MISCGWTAASESSVLQQPSSGVPFKRGQASFGRNTRYSERGILSTEGKSCQEQPISPRNPPIRYRKEIPAPWIKLELTEGKNRQVRKMTAKVGYPTLRLIRYRIDGLTLDDMKPGEIIELPKNTIYKKLSLL